MLKKIKKSAVNGLGNLHIITVNFPAYLDICDIPIVIHIMTHQTHIIFEHQSKAFSELRRVRVYELKVETELSVTKLCILSSYVMMRI